MKPAYAVMLYNLCILAIFATGVFVYQESPLWFILAVMMMATTE
jgi:hypothetical protein